MSDDKPQPNYYAILPAEIRYDKTLTSSLKLMAAEITSLCNKYGYCFAGNQYFADLFDVDSRTVTRWISTLIDKGFIIREIERNPATKEVISRKLRLAGVLTPPDRNVHTPPDNDTDVGTPPDMNVGTPPDTDVRTNNISSLNTKKEKNPIVPKPKPAVDSSVTEAFEFWKALFNKRSVTELTAPRKNAVSARLKAGYTLDDIKQAITACSKDDWHVEHGQTDLAYICRADKLEMFLARADAAKSGSVKPTHSQQSDKVDWHAFAEANLPKPRADFLFLMDVQRENNPEIYHDRSEYERFKAEILAVYTNRGDDENYQLCLRQIAEHEASREFERRFQ